MNGKPKIVFEDIMKIDPYKPGSSSIDGIQNPIKLSSNENPFGASPKAIEAMKEAATRSHRYPDGNCTELREALGDSYSIPADNIVCGAGSDELISLLCQAYAGEDNEVLYSEYGFLIYPISAFRVGATPVKAPEENMKTDVDSILENVTERTKIVFIANPNNPTGSYINKEEMRRLRDNLPGEILLVIDSAYAEYVTAPDYSTGLGMVKEYKNTVMTRTFSKIYGLSSLRLGWAYCSDEVADILNRIRSPFNVSDIAQAAGIAALKDTKFLEDSRAHNEKWRPIVTEKLEAIGLKVYPSVANFILVGFPEEKNANEADKFLKSKGIIGRAMGSYGLPDCMRFTIGLDAENEALIEALTEFLGK